MYLDANNLYGWAMCQTLPKSDFQMFTCTDVDSVKAGISEMKPDNNFGLIFEVDLDYPESLHDLHNDYPLAAEKLQT